MGLAATPFHCQKCEASLDGITPANLTDTLPALGDLTICFYCQAVYMFVPGGVRLVSEDEVSRLEAALDIVVLRSRLRSRFR